MAKSVMGIGLAAVGTFAVIVGGTLSVQGNSVDFLLGSAILLLTPLMWSVYTLMGKGILEKYSPFLIVAYVNILGGLCLIPFSLVEGSFREALTMNINEWSAILYLATTCSFLGYFIWFHVMKQSKASVTSSFMFAEPIVTVLFAAVFLKENVTMLSVAGVLAVLAGVYLVTRRK
jgi:drug/metabolite transporter (DMT)-like permease